MVLRVALCLLMIMPFFQNCTQVYKSKSTAFQSTNGSSNGENPGGGDPGGNPQIAYKFTCSDVNKRGLSETETRRLTRDELFSTLQDLLGATIYAGLTTELQGIPGDAIKERMAEFKQMHSEAHAQAMMTVSMKAADLIVDDANQLSNFVAACRSSVGNVAISATDSRVTYTPNGGSALAGQSLMDNGGRLAFNLTSDMFPQTVTSLTTTLGGQQRNGIWPAFKLYVDGALQGAEVSATDSSTWRPFTVPVNISANTNHKIEIEFSNDNASISYLELYVKEIQFAGAGGSSGGGISLNQACMQNFIRDFGLKVMRRPLTTEEVQSYSNLYAAGSTPQEGLKMVIMGLLQSPYFLFMVEQGSNQMNAGRTRLTDYEIASRLSYRLLGTMPDNDLFAAASRGELQVLANVKAQAERLAQTDKMKNRVEVFFNYWARLNDFPAFTFSNNFLEGINITGLRDEVLAETREFIRYVVWEQKGSVKDLFSSTAAFVRSDRMAQLYGTAKMTGNTPVTLDAERAGILLRPGFLAGGTDTTTPIGRGVMIRRKVLCDTLPSPSADIISSRLGEVGKLDPLTMSNREIVATATSPALCMGCHSMINPIGFAFEAYDGLGRKRTIEKVYDHSTHELVAQHPIDTRVDGLTLDSNAPISVSSAGEIVAKMATGVKGPACMATHIYRFARLRDEVSGDDDCALSDMEHAIKDSGGSILGAFIRNVANDDIFWKKSI